MLIKRKLDALIYLLEWPKSRTLPTADTDKDVEEQELSLIASEQAKWCSHFERDFAGFSLN
jgi:hypothetical protein